MMYVKHLHLIVVHIHHSVSTICHTVGKETTTQPSPAPVVEQQPPPDTSKRSSFRAKLSQRFSTKKGSPVAAKKEQKKGMVFPCRVVNLLLINIAFGRCPNMVVLDN